MWARVENNQVAEIITDNPANRYHPSIKWLPVPAAQQTLIASGWGCDAAGKFTAPPAPSPAEKMTAFAQAIATGIQRLLDTTAASKGYGNASMSPTLSICSYAGSGHPKYGAEAQAFLAWRTAVWDYVYTEQAKAVAGKRAMPGTVEEFIAELPPVVWSA